MNWTWRDYDNIRIGEHEEKKINSSFTGAIRSDFSFNPSTREGILYKGLYQGVGIGFNTYFSKDLLGTPVSVYAYQGAPIVHFSNKLSLGYEWQFWAAFGWHHFDKETAEKNYSVSTSVTAHMGLGLNLNYTLSDRWQMSVGIMMKHYSNGNTSLPNAGVNTFITKNVYINTGYRLGRFQDPQNLMLGIGVRL